jgi:hypothetical protein
VELAELKGYCVYILGPDDRIVNLIDIFCEDDEIAKKKALQLVDSHAVELWHEARKIATFRAEK